MTAFRREQNEEKRRRLAEQLRCYVGSIGPTQPPQQDQGGGSKHFPVWQWEEDFMAETGSQERSRSMDPEASIHAHARQRSWSPTVHAAKQEKAYPHCDTRIPGQEGMLVDTGAVFGLTGGDFV